MDKPQNRDEKKYIARRFAMTLSDFLHRCRQELGLSYHIIQKIACGLILHSPEDEDVANVQIDINVFEKIALLAKHNVPEEVIYTVISQSLNWYDFLDVPKFWRELGVWAKKIDVSKEEIKQDILKYKTASRREFATMPIVDAIRRLQKYKLDYDFIMDKLLDYIIDAKTVENDARDMRADAFVVDTIVRMWNSGWSQEDILRELNKQVDGKSGIDVKKFLRQLPKQLVVNKRKISARDGSVKYVSRIEFLKYINPVLKFFTENTDKIISVSNKYQDDIAGFTRAFYDLYVEYRGWGKFAPQFKLDLDEHVSRMAGFSPEGFVVVEHLSTQEMSVNTIIHELMHFEQYLMLINTADIGITPYVKEHIMNSMLTLSKSYENYDRLSRVVVGSGDFNDFPQDNMPMLMAVAEKRFKNEFYYNALKIPHKKITPESSEYVTVKKLADSFMTSYDHSNKGNNFFVYPNLFSEQMAFDVGNAGAVMFRNIIMRNRENNENITDLGNILSFAGKEM